MIDKADEDLKRAWLGISDEFGSPASDQAWTRMTCSAMEELALAGLKVEAWALSMSIQLLGPPSKFHLDHVDLPTFKELCVQRQAYDVIDPEAAATQSAHWDALRAAHPRQEDADAYDRVRSNAFALGQERLRLALIDFATRVLPPVPRTCQVLLTTSSDDLLAWTALVGRADAAVGPTPGSSPAAMLIDAGQVRAFVTLP